MVDEMVASTVASTVDEKVDQWEFLLVDRKAGSRAARSAVQTAVRLVE